MSLLRHSNVLLPPFIEKIDRISNKEKDNIEWVAKSKRKEELHRHEFF